MAPSGNGSIQTLNKLTYFPVAFIMLFSGGLLPILCDPTSRVSFNNCVSINWAPQLECVFVSMLRYKKKVRD